MKYIIKFFIVNSSCGQIFCADCSEFWAPLPDERLFNPVRLCGPCYHVVTTRIHQVIFKIWIITNYIFIIIITYKLKIKLK